ncbi:Uromodulin [Stylophora pistillata]|uniref:Uromodulin n=1 Tax=Stylophora pistillata TaxID=50429 RepID=A0A2B4S876_STYPI|nr:Uromodulin [Stylophora pistillata]
MVNENALLQQENSKLKRECQEPRKGKQKIKQFEELVGKEITDEDILSKQQEIKALHEIASDKDNLTQLQQQQKDLLLKIEFMQRMQSTADQERDELLLYKQRSMYLIFRQLMSLLFAFAVKSVTANDQCRSEVNIQAPLGSIPELPALSCHEAKASEGKTAISGNYWLDPTGTGKSVLIYCDMANMDIDECSDDSHACDVSAMCTNTGGSHNCTCMEGYNGDGNSCQDIGECGEGSNVCDENASCTNTKGSRNCTCKEGFTGNGQSCQVPSLLPSTLFALSNVVMNTVIPIYIIILWVSSNDIDECNNGSHLCNVNANCANTNGSHNCTCKEGYLEEGRSCQDIDECGDGSHVCDENANCTNTEGAHNCTCMERYTGNGSSCQVDPCYNYSILDDANRKNSYITNFAAVLCDNQLFEGWYRFVGAAGTKMPTTRVPADRCGTVWSGWLDGTHPIVEDASSGPEERTSLLLQKWYQRTPATGSTVRINPPKYKQQWTQATVEEQVGVRSYQVTTDDGRVYRRNRRHLRLTAELPKQSPLDTEIPSSDRGPLPLTKVEQVPPVVESKPQEVFKPQATPNPPADDVSCPERCSARGRVLRRPAYLHDYTC